MLIARTLRHVSASVKHSSGRLAFLDQTKSFVPLGRSMSSTKRLDLSGVFPPIATPFDKNEDISWGKLEHNVNKWNQCNFKGYVVEGSNGEYVFLTWEERVELVKRIKQLAAPGKLIIAGSGCESTRDTITMTRLMGDAGADAVLVVTPCYYKSLMHSDALLQHYTKLADASPVPIILYSVPANTSIDLPADVIIKLSSHPNIIGLKDSAGDVAKLGNLIHKVDKDFQILAGSASFMFPAMAIGCVGGVCALANVLGHETCELHSLAKQGILAEAKKLQNRLIGPNAAVTKRFGVPGLKAGMEWFGLYGGPPRSPLQALSASDVDVLKGMFLASGFQPQ